MKFEDWHTHNSLCSHAEGLIEDYIQTAIEMNIGTLGISDHFPYEFYNNLEHIPHQGYSMRLDQVENYLDTIEFLKEKYEYSKFIGRQSVYHRKWLSRKSYGCRATEKVFN